MRTPTLHVVSATCIALENVPQRLGPFLRAAQCRCVHLAPSKAPPTRPVRTRFSGLVSRIWALSSSFIILAIVQVASVLAPATASMTLSWGGDLPIATWHDRMALTQHGIMLRRLACSRRAARCLGFGLLPPWNFSARRWRSLREQDLVAVTVPFHQSLARSQPELSKLHHFVSPHFEDAVRDCAGGAVTALAYGMQDMSQTVGDEVAARAFKLASYVVWVLQSCGGSEWELVRGGGTRGTRFAPNFPAFPSLFGFVRQRSCGIGGSSGVDGLRIHIREVGRSDQFVRCSSGLRSTETWFHRQLMSFDCSGPAPARHRERGADGGVDFIFVPLYSVCNHLRKQGFSELADHAWYFPFARPYFELAEEHQRIVQSLVGDMGALERLLLFFPEEKWPYFGAGWASSLGSGLPRGGAGRSRPRLLVVEARPVHCSHYDTVRVEVAPGDSRVQQHRCFHCHDCFRPGYDVVVPSFFDLYTRTLLMENNLEYHGRRWLVVWLGNGGPDSSDGAYTEVMNWRFRLASMRTLKGAIIGAYHERYEYLLGESRFCLIPKGLGYWTHRLYEAIRAGCVPVILSDHVVLPFQGVEGIDWPLFSAKWPEGHIGPDLYRWLLHLDFHRGPAMKAAVDRVACWFDYHSPADAGCHPVRATVAELAKQKAGEQVVRLPDFWNSPKFTLHSPEEQFDEWALAMEAMTNATPLPRAKLDEERRLAGAVFGGLLA